MKTQTISFAGEWRGAEPQTDFAWNTLASEKIVQRSSVMMPTLQPIYVQPYRVLSFTGVVAGLIIALVLTSQPSRAADAAATEAEAAKPAPKETFKEQFGDVWSRELFTGDWEGWRTALQ
jgi:hypothetical protein